MLLSYLSEISENVVFFFVFTIHMDKKHNKVIEIIEIIKVPQQKTNLRRKYNKCRRGYMTMVHMLKLMLQHWTVQPLLLTWFSAKDIYNYKKRKKKKNIFPKLYIVMKNKNLGKFSLAEFTHCLHLHIFPNWSTQSEFLISIVEQVSLLAICYWCGHLV